MSLAAYEPNSLGTLHMKGIILGILSGLAAVGISVAGAQFSRQTIAAPSNTTSKVMIPPAARQGYTLFLLNCAHCHGKDARGDEGPDLHALTKSDARISALIKNGIKGEMPKFGEKLTDTDVQALIAFLRSLSKTKS